MFHGQKLFHGQKAFPSLSSPLVATRPLVQSTMQLNLAALTVHSAWQEVTESALVDLVLLAETDMLVRCWRGGSRVSCI